MELSVLEQLRLQEGRLFQSEAVVALFLDVKTVASDALQKAENTSKFTSLDDESIQILINNLKSLGPKGYKDYHVRSVHECVKTVAKLLWPSEILLVAKPSLGALMSGVLKRIVTAEAVEKNQFFSIDPIKQDFLFREAFRRTLVNDCLTVFEEESRPEVAVLPGVREDEDEIGPDDSISFVGSRPSGARSVISATSRIQDQPDAATVMPRVIQVQADRSVVSAAKSAYSVAKTNVSVPLNVKRIHIIPEES
jgi:hypothetical protein